MINLFVRFMQRTNTKYVCKCTVSEEREQCKMMKKTRITQNIYLSLSGAEGKEISLESPKITNYSCKPCWMKHIPCDVIPPVTVLLLPSHPIPSHPSLTTLLTLEQNSKLKHQKKKEMKWREREGARGD